jgi:hypothetical protein
MNKSFLLRSGISYTKGIIEGYDYQKPPDNAMLQRSILQPAASLKEKDVNNLRCNRRYGSSPDYSAPQELDINDIRAYLRYTNDTSSF